MELKDKKATDFNMIINRGIKHKERHYFEECHFDTTWKTF